MRTTFTVNCMMCGRASGHLRDGTFTRWPNAPAPDLHAGRTRCGFCGGNLYLEADDSLAANLSSEEALRAARRIAS